MSTLSSLSAPSQATIATAVLKQLGVPVPSFKPSKQNPRGIVNPMRRAKKAIRVHFGLDSGRAWRRFRRWVLR